MEHVFSLYESIKLKLDYSLALSQMGQSSSRASTPPSSSRSRLTNLLPPWGFDLHRQTRREGSIPHPRRRLRLPHRSRMSSGLQVPGGEVNRAQTRELLLPSLRCPSALLPHLRSRSPPADTHLLLSLSLQPLPSALEKTTGLALLRACNVLLARLSKSQDSVFCGRILSFMASAFSLGARSGVNLRGDFNVGNETFFEDVEELMAEEELPEAVEEDVEMKDVKTEATEEGEEAEEEEEGVLKDEIEEGETNEDSIPEVPKKEIKAIVEEKKEELVNREFASRLALLSPPQVTNQTFNLRSHLPAVTTETFYKTFWSLQAFFANPSLLSTPPPSTSDPSSSTSSSSSSPFSDFQIRVDRVIATLAGETEKEKVLRGTGDGSASNGGGTGKDGKKDAVGGLDEVFMPKFLTSPGLLAFEVRPTSSL